MRPPSHSELSDVLGTPFAYGGRGPDKLDCYGLLLHLYGKQGKRLPDYRSPNDQREISALMGNALQLWERVDEPAPGDAVVFRIGRLVSHCGVVLQHDRFVHCWEGSQGVCIERLTDWRQRVHGYYRFVGTR